MTLAELPVALLAVLGLYFVGMSRSAEQLSRGRQRQHLALFVLGSLAALLVFVPSPDLFGPDHRFAVNMGQFVLAVDVGPLLLFLGIPAAWLQPLLRWDRLGRRLTHPLLLGLLSSAVLVGWHLPIFFEAASRDLTLWLLKQALFLVAGLLLWTVGEFVMLMVFSIVFFNWRRAAEAATPV